MQEPIESPTIVMEPEFLYRESILNVNPFKRIKEMSNVYKNHVASSFLPCGIQEPVFQDLLPCFARLNYIAIEYH